MSEILKSLLQVAPILNKGLITDCMIGITDMEKFLAYYPAKTLNLEIKPGDPLRPGSINHTALHEKRKVIRVVPREVYGVPYIAAGFPIADNGEVVGCLSTGMSTDREDRIRQMAEELAEAVGNIAGNAEILAKSSSELAAVSQEVNASATQVQTGIDETSRMSESIKNIATKINILGLNASIESARAGVHGRGFSIVAEEIRRLSDSTAITTKNITKQLEEMNQQISVVVKEMERTLNFTVQQATGVQELTSVIQLLKNMTMELSEMARMNVQTDQ
ncbi:methyl-accepting chemotaxis protein [Effusibacillus lacus]|uniref:Methyl-accepting chemotaxis protein n=1 Tax=Effusibacillus lacus TaxID=1348429 RepID=A0A292YK33_9BACL|nr:methyl-accepting chemotaxis protein [Effusibacillus lacus]TCS72801.1 methyl-accepting chemotaxis protein (MCP) signaling protein [Effusibacillus lacus]GAX89271.1 methyl-accepting chemotaxis protein [Effusibacillus lacus]